VWRGGGRGFGLRRARWSRPLAVAAWCVVAALVAASALLLLDMVGILLPGIGVTVHLVAFLSRAACLVGGVLVGPSRCSTSVTGMMPAWRAEGRATRSGLRGRRGLLGEWLETRIVDDEGGLVTRVRKHVYVRRRLG
jgi:hypothetical protein